MCTQCVAQGVAYAVPGLAALRLWSRARLRRTARVQVPVERSGTPSR